MYVEYEDCCQVHVVAAGFCLKLYAGVGKVNRTCGDGDGEGLGDGDGGRLGDAGLRENPKGLD